METIEKKLSNFFDYSEFNETTPELVDYRYNVIIVLELELFGDNLTEESKLKQEVNIQYEFDTLFNEKSCFIEPNKKKYKIGFIHNLIKRFFYLEADQSLTHVNFEKDYKGDVGQVIRAINVSKVKFIKIEFVSRFDQI
ncbi:hypothetical protein VB264_16750 [Arcicella aquatica]|uniref:Immunity protein 50 of polymorphic toxin system n=1 Tax=Arcicella aquatica TaxID=217141 RepID=A0ABU5QQU1_9BACT|nr:hypothetical protein [Arcicella aquatica]MEA5259451.1 hypothetical protein [Arcicella aquatica]